MHILDGVITNVKGRNLRGSELIRKTVRLLRSGDEYVYRNKFGALIAVNLHDYIDGIILKEGYYEEEVLTCLLHEAPKGAVIWDVGANLGLHAVTAKVLRPDITVVAFEPSPEQAARVFQNAKLNGVELQVVVLGLSDRNGAMRLHSVSGNPGMSTLVPWAGATYNRSPTLVGVARGDDLVSGGLVAEPWAIKIDVEGGEAAAMAGLSHTLNTVKRIIFEGDEVVDTLLQLDFHVVKLDRLQKSSHALSNFVATRSSPE